MLGPEGNQFDGEECIEVLNRSVFWATYPSSGLLQPVEDVGAWRVCYARKWGWQTRITGQFVFTKSAIVASR